MSVSRTAHRVVPLMKIITSLGRLSENPYSSSYPPMRIWPHLSRMRMEDLELTWMVVASCKSKRSWSTRGISRNRLLVARNLGRICEWGRLHQWVGWRGMRNEAYLWTWTHLKGTIPGWLGFLGITSRPIRVKLAGITDRRRLKISTFFIWLISQLWKHIKQQRTGFIKHLLLQLFLRPYRLMMSKIRILSRNLKNFHSFINRASMWSTIT